MDGRTIKLLVAVDNARRGRSVAGLLVVHIACNGWSATWFDRMIALLLPFRDLRRTKEVVKVRRAMARGAARRAAAKAVRWRNMAGAIGVERWVRGVLASCEVQNVVQPSFDVAASWQRR